MADTNVVSDLSKLPDVLQVNARDVDVEENAEIVNVLLLDQVIEIRPDRLECLRQLLAIGDRIHREIEGGHAGIGQPVDDLGARQTAVGGHIDPEALLHGVVGDFVRKIRPEQNLASHQCQNPATAVV